MNTTRTLPGYIRLRSKQADEYIDLANMSMEAGCGAESAEFMRIAENQWMLIQYAEELGRAPELREEIDFVAGLTGVTK